MSAATELAALLDPLLEACSSPEGADRLLRELGVLGTPSLPPELPPQLVELAAATQAAIDAVLALDEPSVSALERTAGLAAAMADLFAAIAELGALDAGAVADLAAPFDAPELWPLLADALPEWLLVSWLREGHRATFDALALLGVVSVEGGGAPSFDFARLTEVASSFGAAVGERLAADPGLVIAPLRRALDERGATRNPPDLVLDAQVAQVGELAGPCDGRRLDATLPAGAGRPGASVSAEPADTGSGRGVSVSADGLDALSEPVALGAGWTLEASGGPGVAALVAGSSWTEPLDTATLDSAEVVLAGTPAVPWALLGGAGSTRLELPSVEASISASALLSEPELRVALATEGLRLVLVPGEADSFLVALLGAEELAAELALDAAWSPSGGLTVSGATGLEIHVPLSLVLGPVSVDGVAIGLAAVLGESIAVEVTADLGARLGPFGTTVSGIGLSLELRPEPAAGVQLGPLCAAVAFRPPDGIGFALELEGIASGGGYVSHDEATGRYSGALALELLELGLGAVVVVDTELPGDPDGWALFASVYATFPSIPLGFGFFLSGVGGILCVDRALDTEALADGLRSGAVDAILFPDDPLADAPLIVESLDAWFPAAPGSTVIGVAAAIDWGVPALVTGELAVVLSWPDLDLALLGSVSMALPDEQTALLELHMDALGAVDVSEGTVSIVASLYDSSLLRTISLSGDMAMYASFGAEPYFLLAIGGYHPNFDPPAGLPASVTNLRRVGYEVALGEDLWFGLSGYVAVTSNTLQFGAQAAIEASARFLGVTYTASGSLGFDVLLVFSPFSFSADVHASVEVSAGDAELIVAELAVHLEGPEPWYATGYARFEFLGIGVRFEVTVGGAAGAVAPPRVNLLDAVVARLEQPAAWRGVAASIPVLLVEEAQEDEPVLRVRPDAELEAVQSEAPLERDLDVYGIYAIEGPTTLEVEDAGLDGASVASEPVLDWFAPAQYDAMTRSQKLTAPSYEQMTAGVRLAQGDPAVGADSRSVTPDYEVRVLDEDATRRLEDAPLAGTLADAAAGRVLDPAVRGTQPRVASVPHSFAVVAPQWTLVDAVTGEAVGEPGSYRDGLAALDALGAAGASAPGATRVAPSHATRTVA